MRSDVPESPTTDLTTRIAPSPTTGSGPARSIPLRELAYRTLKEDILCCRRRAGETLNEKDVAAQLGISKTPIREALTMLMGEGFVEVYPRQGSIVRHAAVRDIHNVMLVRQLTEPEVSAQAASRATSDDVARLHELDRLQMAGSSESLDLEMHARFHVTVAEVARIPQLTTVVRAMQDQMRWFLASHAADGGAPYPKHNHAELVDAIERRQPDEARGITEQSISMSRGNLLRHLLGE